MMTASTRFNVRPRAAKARVLGACMLAVLACSCSSSQPNAVVVADAAVPEAPPAPPPLFGTDPPQTAKITIKLTDTRFWVAEHMSVGFEMQQSGEPLSESMGRSLAGYRRYFLPPDRYYDPAKTWDPNNHNGPFDLVGFSTAVESYEYSKQPMNNLAFEGGAGTSFLFSPLINPSGKTGADALALTRAWVQHLGQASDATSFWISRAAGTARNPIGWPGFWPTLHPFKSFDPAIKPTGAADLRCFISADDDPGDQGNVLVGDYECDYTTLHLNDRTSQIDATITPGASGWSGWKNMLWAINYTQIAHDFTNTALSGFADADMAKVGTPGNSVVGIAAGPGNPPLAGSFLGSSDIEGFQAAMFVSINENQAVDWLTNLTTTDGSTLSGFASLKEALSYDETSPLRWIPAEISVTETADASGFPNPSTRKIAVNESRIFDLMGLAGSYASLHALTDHANQNIGGNQTVRVYFDGDPFPDDDQIANGDPTPHDRALAMLRVILVNVVRLHRDPATGLIVDNVTFSGGAPTRGDTIDAVNAAYTLVGLRSVRRSLSSDLALYTNLKPDARPTSTPLDVNPWKGGDGKNIAEKLNGLLQVEADLFYDHLTDQTGRAYGGWSLKANAPSTTDDTLLAHAAAIRGLTTAYFATGNVKYRDRALAVYLRMEKVFYDPAARVFDPTPAPLDDFSYSPRLFGMVQSAMRELYEGLGERPGNDLLGTHLQDRIARLNKLILNGWDDRNQNQTVDWPDECANFDTKASLPRGGLQMAERALSGETGSLDDRLSTPAIKRVATFDREADCVPEIDDAKLPSALAHKIDLHVERH